jgi:hypothetical protein
MALRCGELEQLLPEALDIAAAMVAALHDALHGQATELRGARSAGYRRQQLRGEHGVTLEDVSQLALDAPDAVVASVQVLARALGFSLQPVAARAVPVGEGIAGTAESSGRLVAMTQRASSDGAIDPEEQAQIEAEILQHEQRLEELRASVRRGGAR